MLSCILVFKGIEILEDVPDPDVIVVCCGGGGLLAGVATAVKLRRPGCRVVGVEPQTANTMQSSLESGLTDYLLFI